MENKVTARNPITEGCIWKGMLLFALPIMLGSLLQQLYNTADAVIVGSAVVGRLLKGQFDEAMTFIHSLRTALDEKYKN